MATLWLLQQTVCNTICQCSRACITTSHGLRQQCAPRQFALSASNCEKCATKESLARGEITSQAARFLERDCVTVPVRRTTKRKPKQVLLLPPPRLHELAVNSLGLGASPEIKIKKKKTLQCGSMQFSLFGAVASRFWDVAGATTAVVLRGRQKLRRGVYRPPSGKRSSTSPITNAYPNFTLRRSPRASLRCTSCVYSVTSKRLLVQV